MGSDESTITTQSGEVFHFEGHAGETPDKAGNYQLITAISHGISVRVRGSISSLMKAANTLSEMKNRSQAKQVAALSAIKGVSAAITRQIDAQLPSDRHPHHRRASLSGGEEFSAQL